MRTRRATVVVLAATAAFVTSGIAGSLPVRASASDGQVEINTGNGWSSSADGPLFDLSKFVPGQSAESTFAVRNDSNSTSSLTISADNVTDDDNGCTPDEELVDQTCGQGQGELGREMQWRIYLDKSDSGNFDNVPSWTGTIVTLQQAVELAESMPAGAIWRIRMAAFLPRSAGNECQTDQIGFGLEVRIQGDDAQVLGTTYQRGGGGPSALAEVLPFTGSRTSALLSAALLLLVTGVGLTQVARPGRGRHRSAVP